MIDKQKDKLQRKIQKNTSEKNSSRDSIALSRNNLSNREVRSPGKDFMFAVILIFKLDTMNIII